MTSPVEPAVSTRRRALTLLSVGAALLVVNHLVSILLGSAYLVSTLFGPVFITVGVLLLLRPQLLEDDPAAITRGDRVLVIASVATSLVVAVGLWGVVYASPAP